MQAYQIPVPPAEHHKLLVNFLADHRRLSRRKAKALLDERRVFVNRRRVWMARHVLQRGDLVEVQEAARALTVQPDRILYQDAEFVIADKPTGYLSNGPRSLETRLREILQKPELVAVHRLDRDTSGCNLFATSARWRDVMIPLFERRQVTKLYHAIVVGRLPERKMEIQLPVDGHSATTRIEVLDSQKLASHIKALPETGRTHQIRKHLAALHHPIVGDKAYATGAARQEILRQAPRQMLHARLLLFTHPTTGARIVIRAGLPADFSACLRMLKLT